MTSQQYSFCISEALKYTDRAAFVSDLCLSSIWGDPEGAEIPLLRDWAMGDIWDAVHRSFRDILTDAKISRAAFSRYFCVPLRTVENWLGGINAPPLYVRLAFQRLLVLHVVAVDRDWI